MSIVTMESQPQQVPSQQEQHHQQRALNKRVYLYVYTYVPYMVVDHGIYSSRSTQKNTRIGLSLCIYVCTVYGDGP
jgi:hypothetical protein